MKYKLVCIDMDGTLLNSKHKISETSKKVLKKAYNMGVHIVISTGRIYVDAKGYSNLIGVKSPVIASNGAVIKEKDRSEVIYKSVIDKKLCFKLLDVCFKHDVVPNFSTSDKLYTGSILVSIFFEITKLKGGINKEVKIEYVKSFGKWNKVLEKEKDNIVKCEVMNKSKSKLRKFREELKKIKEIELASSSKHNVEITCKGVSKGRAVKVLANYYNIKREEIIAIGDSENDLSMIEFAVLGIAMGNAIDMVKEKADFITDTNDNDGVAKAVDKFVLNN
jgi:Cof subfamily protein (haloacid dehalogenase superfamily)